MGYADTLPYQQLTLRTSTRASAMNITNLVQDFDIADFVIPTFTRPLTHAFMSIHVNNIWNTSLNDNYLDVSGSWGIKDSGGTYHAIQGVAAYTFLIAGNTLSCGEYVITSTADVKDYITSGASQTVRFEDIKAVFNGIDVHNTFAQLDLYYIE